MLTGMTQETAGNQTKDESKKDQASLLRQLMTESQNEASQGFDTKSALEIARIINHEDAKVAGAVKKAIPEIAQVIDQVARSLRDGGRLIYIGAGSSGRIAALDASECPPTYSSAPGQVQYIMAGGPKALASAVEVNEDSEELGQRDIARRRPTRKDVVIGVSASGRTPYVCVREPDGERAHAELEAGRTRHPHPDVRLQYRPRHGRGNDQERRPQRARSAGYAEGARRQARGRPSPCEIRWQRAVGH